MLIDSLRSILWPSLALDAPKVGLHHFPQERDGVIRRTHLRVDPDGSGVLVVNARGIVRLSPVGVHMAHGLLSGQAEDRIVASVARRFRGYRRPAIRRDLEALKATLEALATGEAGSRASFGDPARGPFTTALLAPLCADVRVASLASGRAIVDRLRSVGVPHVVWVLEGSEPAGHLPELVERAEDHGLVCGLRARASDLPAQALEGAIAAGLDHVDLLFGGADTRHAEIFGQDDLGHLRAHLEAVRGEMLGCRAVVPLPTEERHLSIADLVDGVVARGFGTAAFFFLVAATPEPEAVGALLRQWSVDLERALEVTRLPGEICVPEQVAAEGWRAQARRGPRTIGEATVGVTGEGLVLPPEGPATPAGNLIGERWDRIWAAPVFSAWREAGAEPERCGVCPGLEACRRGCLADPGRFVRADDRAAAEEVEA